MDVSIKGLEPEVVARLAEQAAVEGVSAQEWMRQSLRRTAALLTPHELETHVAARTPMPEQQYDEVLRTVAASRSAASTGRAAGSRVRHRGR